MLINMNSKELLRNLIKFCFPTLISALVNIGIIPVISRVYPAEEYGKIALFYTVGNMGWVICLLGLDQAYIRFFKEPIQDATNDSIFFYTLFIGIVTESLLLLTSVYYLDVVSNYLFGERNISMVGALFLFILSLMIFRLCNLTARMEQNAKLYNIQQITLIICTRASFLCAIFVSVNYKYGVIFMTLSTFIFAIVFFIKQCFYTGININMPRFSTQMELLRYSLPLMPATVATWVNNSVSKLMLRSMGDFESVGIIAIAMSIANVFSLLPNAFGVYWSTFMYTYYKQENKLIRNVHDYITLLSLFLLIGIVIFQDVLFLIAGEQYRVAQPFFMLLILGPVQIFLTETTSYGIQIARKTKYYIYISVIACAVNLMVCYFTIPFWGMLGAAIGMAASSIILLILNTLIGQYYYTSIDNPLKTAIACILMFMLSIVNIFIYNMLIVKLGICCVVIAISWLMYKKEVICAIKTLKSIGWKK